MPQKIILRSKVLEANANIPVIKKKFKYKIIIENI
jgi:hypothetical protein